jgi:integrase
MAKIIEGFADRLNVPAGARDVQVFDDELPGFGIRKFASGKATYFVKFTVGTQQRRKTLGRTVRGNLRAMRLEASAILAKARLGTDVVAIAKAEAVKSNLTLAATVPRYLAARQQELRPKTFVDTKRYLERSWAPLHGLSLESVARRDVVATLDDIEAASSAVTADRAKAALSGLYGWAIDRGLAESNPTLGVRARAPGGGRDRVLSEQELAAIWRACEDAGEFGSCVRLLLLLGQRRSEVGGLRWGEINFERAQLELPESRTKNRRAHLVPLPEAAMSILQGLARQDRELVFGRGTTGFAGWGRGVGQLNARLPQMMPPWRLHDLRRTLATGLRERRFADSHLVELILNHVSGTRAGVAGTYDRSERLEERRQALELWAEHIAALVAGKASKVVPLRRAQSGGINAAE